MKRSVGIIVHRTRLEAWEFAAQVIAWLQAREVGVRLDEESARKLKRPELSCCGDEWEGVDFVITLGGDGTILTAARMAAPRGIPILGVHMGRFGFIAETHPDALFMHLEKLLEGEMKVEERMMLGAEVWRDGEKVQHSLGLNEVIVKSGDASLLNLQTRLAGAPFATYPADGMIIATPTGSTAYALSAGGPIVAPTVQALIIAPICPHTLNVRPMIVPCDEQIEIILEMQSGDVLFKVDGVDPFALQNGDRVVAHRSAFVTRLIVLGHATFYRKVRDRYLYGERLNE